MCGGAARAARAPLLHGTYRIPVLRPDCEVPEEGHVVCPRRYGRRGTRYLADLGARHHLHWIVAARAGTPLRREPAMAAAGMSERRIFFMLCAFLALLAYV